ncbi:hypothetical protein Tco_0313057 [Tanacetum coccineum]
MHQFWNTIQKIKDTDTYRFKLDKKKFRVDTKVFREILHICPRLLNQDFFEPPSEEELVPFIQELSCISGKTTGLDRIRESRAQILWARKEHMPNPRFTKVINNHFIYKVKTISMRNMINLHIIRDDTLLGTLKFVFKSQDYQQYGALILDEMINQDIKDSKAYKTYLKFSTGKATPKKARNFKKVSSPSKKLSPILEEEPIEKPKKVPNKVDRGKGMDLLSEIALLEAAQLKKTLKKRKLETHKLHASGPGDGVGSQLKVPDESKDKTTGTNKGTSTKPGVPDVLKYHSECNTPKIWVAVEYVSGSVTS